MAEENNKGKSIQSFPGAENIERGGKDSVSLVIKNLHQNMFVKTNLLG